MDSLGTRIVGKRREKCDTLRHVAAEAGISPALLSLIERDRHKPSPQIIVRLATVLGGDADEWCGLLGKMTPDTESELARIASKDPVFFRSMVRHLGR